MTAATSTVQADAYTGSNQPSDKKPRYLDLERLRQHDNVKIITSIDRIGICLGYLAQCDYACGNTVDNLNDDAHFGRGYLLDMLSDGVNYFAKEYENIERLYDEQIQQSNSGHQQYTLLQNQVTNLSTINEKYQQLLSIDDQNSKQAKLLQQQIDTLNSHLGG